MKKRRLKKAENKAAIKWMTALDILVNGKTRAVPGARLTWRERIATKK